MRNGKLHFLCSVSCPQISAFSRNPGIQNYRKWKIWFWWYGKKTFSTLNFFSQKFFLDLFSISQWNWTKIAQFIQRKFCKSFYNQGKLKQNKMENLLLIISFFFSCDIVSPTWDMTGNTYFVLRSTSGAQLGTKCFVNIPCSGHFFVRKIKLPE